MAAWDLGRWGHFPVAFLETLNQGGTIIWCSFIGWFRTDIQYKYRIGTALMYISQHDVQNSQPTFEINTNQKMMSSPLATVNNCRTWWRSSTVVVARTLRLGSAHSLVEVGSLRTAAALHRCVTQSAARVQSRQGAARVVAGLHSVGESLVLLTRNSCGQHGHAWYLLIPSILLNAVVAFQKPYCN